MDKCCYLINENKCNGKIKYGLYCYKHRGNHLIDDNKLINQPRAKAKLRITSNSLFRFFIL